VPAPAAYAVAQAGVDAARDEIADLVLEQQAVTKALATPLPPEPVHAHLRHRALPDQDVLQPTRWTLRFWASISVSVLVGILVAIAGIEALIRGRLLPFLAGVVIITLILLGIYLAVTNIRVAIAAALVLAAVALLLSNLFGYLRRR
jgi:membrane-bound ClpP family serine protease